MPAPKGRYTPSRGVLAGRTFPSYYAYQSARAQALGFASYRSERVAKLDPVFQALYHRAVAAGMPRNAAISDVGQFYRTNRTASGLRKHNAIKFAIDQGWVDDYDQENDDWAPY